MPRVHFLNVNDGDCSIIEHGSGRVTVIDISAAKKPARSFALMAERYVRANVANHSPEYSVGANVDGTFDQSDTPDNPIEYLRGLGHTSVFRFISTHPDMDHLDGVKAFFEAFSPSNFWDTDNTKEIDEGGPYNYEDWKFYRRLREGRVAGGLTRLTLYSGSTGQFYNRGPNGTKGGDGLQVLAPTPELVSAANDAGDWNDSSYVILYRVGGKRVLFAGDSHDTTWDHILSNHLSAIRNVDVLIAPHHGRDSDRDYRFLKWVNPTLTLFGNAPDEHMAYDQWNEQGLMFITNDQAGRIILDGVDNQLDVYIAHEDYAREFARVRGRQTYYSQGHDGWFLGRL